MQLGVFSRPSVSGSCSMPLSTTSAPLGCSSWAAKAARSASSGRGSRPWGGWAMMLSTLTGATSLSRSASAARCRVMVSSSGFERAGSLDEDSAELVALAAEN